LDDNRQAAIALIAGLVINPNDKEFVASLAKLYQQMDPKGCAIAQVNGEPRVNWTCPLVHEHVCMAYQSLVRLCIEIKQDHAAYQLKVNAVTNMGCPVEPFNQILPEGPVF
jgi:hypothetical protein